MTLILLLQRATLRKFFNIYTSIIYGDYQQKKNWIFFKEIVFDAKFLPFTRSPLAYHYNQKVSLQIPPPSENFGHFQGGDLYKIQNRAAPAAGFFLVEFHFENCIGFVEICIMVSIHRNIV